MVLEKKTLHGGRATELLADSVPMMSLSAIMLSDAAKRASLSLR